MKELMATVKNIQKQLAFVLLVLLQSQENSKVASQHSLLIKQSKYRWNWHPSNMHVFYFLCTSFLDRLRIEQCISGALCLTNVIFKWIKASTLTSPHIGIGYWLLHLNKFTKMSLVWEWVVYLTQDYANVCGEMLNS